jgi:hypothetical protein
MISPKFTITNGLVTVKYRSSTIACEDVHFWEWWVQTAEKKTELINSPKKQVIMPSIISLVSFFILSIQQLIFSAVQKFFGWGNSFPRMCLKLPLFRENTCHWKRKKATSMKFLWNFYGFLFSYFLPLIFHSKERKILFENKYRKPVCSYDSASIHFLNNQSSISINIFSMLKPLT